MLIALPLALALFAPGATALAAEATTGYSQTTPPPTTTTVTTTTTTPAVTTTQTATQEVAPTQTSSTPTAKHEVKPTGSGGEPSSSSTTPHATTLPFTGLDLRWVIVAGMLLLGTGLSIMYVQRGRQGAGR